MSTSTPVLRTEALSIRFGGHVAVNAVSTEFASGTLTAIVGPNGAGKTTYFNLLSGQLRATSGSVHFKGVDITRLGPAERTHLGIGRAFQPTAGMSVDEVPVILDLIQRLKDEGQRTILLVEHKMDVIRSLADRIIVFHNGQLVADGEPAAVMASPVVQEAYMGAKVAVHA